MLQEVHLSFWHNFPCNPSLPSTTNALLLDNIPFSFFSSSFLNPSLPPLPLTPPPHPPPPTGNHIAFDNTGNKYGPCGPFSGMYGMNGVRALKPGPLTLTWEESIAHVGSPFRLAILDENEEVKVVLADHIPHNDAAKSSFLERTYTPYHLTVEIPDVKCEKCTLQLIYFMTDKTVKCGSLLCTYHADDSACSGQIDAAEPTCFGAPNDVPCKEKDSCFSNYHTCTDVSIAGTRAFDEFELDLPVGMEGGREEGWEGKGGERGNVCFCVLCVCVNPF